MSNESEFEKMMNGVTKLKKCSKYIEPDQKTLYLQVRNKLQCLINQDTKPEQHYRCHSELVSEKKIVLNRSSQKLIVQDSNDGLDQKLASRLKRGEVPIDVVIDLHNMTEDEAHITLYNIINKACIDNLRLVLVITGKGNSSESGVGVIRKNLISWVNNSTLKFKIAAIFTAHKKHGGSGAFYFYLKR